MSLYVGTIKRFEQHVDGLDFTLFLAMDEAGEIIGSVEAKRGHRRMMFRNLFVAPTHRRQGVARALMGQLFELAGSTGRYLSCVVMSNNHEAMALYRKPVEGWRLMEQDCNLELVTLEWWPTK